MIATIFAESRKLLTVRSTYVVSGIALLIISFFTFYGVGYKGTVFDDQVLMRAVLQSAGIVGMFAGVLSIMHICHEYRFGTIAYTLTTSNNRLKVFAAKFLVSGAFGIVMALLTIGLTIGMVMAGVALAGNDLGQQSIELYPLLWRTLFFLVSSVWFGLLLGILSRSLAFSMTIYFFLPVVEQILHSLLKFNLNYLPNAAQNAVVSPMPIDEFSTAASAGIFTLYLLGMTVVSAILFNRRDAN